MLVAALRLSAACLDRCRAFRAGERRSRRSSACVFL